MGREHRRASVWYAFYENMNLSSMKIQSRTPDMKGKNTSACLRRQFVQVLDLIDRRIMD